VFTQTITIQHFSGAIQIVDLYHARQHLWDLAAKWFPADGKVRQRRIVANEAQFLLRNAERMRYPAFRRQGLFVGSGVVEAGCKTVIAAPLKRSGMFWSVRGANAIFALRTCRLSRRFEDYWVDRSCAG